LERVSAVGKRWVMGHSLVSGFPDLMSRIADYVNKT
jgi:hypothetical protein